MPQPGMHMLLASEVLDAWSRTAPAAPFDASDPENRNAFLHGSLGPDIGFYPGGPRVVSELVHTRASGAFLRTLLGMARTESQTAFAWGWLTHVIADVTMHPIINAHADELSRAHGMTHRADWLVAHVQIEVGMDAWYLRRQSVSDFRLFEPFGTVDLDFLSAALALTYGEQMSPASLHGALRNVTRLTNMALPFVVDTIGRSARAERAGHSLWSPGRHLLGRWMGPRAPATGFVVPVLPSRTFVRRLSAAHAAFTRAYHAQVANGARDLEDYDLNSGRRAATVRTAGTGARADCMEHAVADAV